MKSFLYVSVMVVLTLCVYVSHASENRGQLVLIAGRDKDAVLQDTGSLQSCTFAFQNPNNSAVTSMMEVVSDVDYPAFLVLKTGERDGGGYISIKIDNEGRTHIHEKTKEIQSFIEEARKTQGKYRAIKEAQSQIKEELRAYRYREECAKKVALGVGLGVVGAAFVCWLCNHPKIVT